MNIESDKQRIAFNMIFSMGAVAVNAILNFFVTTYIARELGVEAQGFLQIANTVINYLMILTGAISSMSSRFIAVEIYQNKREQARIYYTSAFIGVSAIIALITVTLILCILFLERLLVIPAAMVTDVKLSFVFMGINILTLNMFSIWNVGFYARDKIYLQSAGELAKQLVSIAIFLICALSLIPKMWYHLLAYCVTIPITVIWAYLYRRKNFPWLTLSIKLFSLKKIYSVLSAVIWRIVQSLGGLLQSGLVLVMANLYVGIEAMGELAIARNLPTLVAVIQGTITGTFTPQLVKRYTLGEDMLYEIRRASKVTSIICGVPVGMLIALGTQLFRYWLPNVDAARAVQLSLPMLVWFGFTIGISPLTNVFVAVNKVKPIALAVTVCGVCTFAITLGTLNITNYGVYAIALISPLVQLILDIGYTIPKTANILGQKWYKLYFCVLYSIICSGFPLLISFVASRIFVTNSMLKFLTLCAVTACVSILVNALIIFDREEKTVILNSIISKIINTIRKDKYK